MYRAQYIRRPPVTVRVALVVSTIGSRYVQPLASHEAAVRRAHASAPGSVPGHTRGSSEVQTIKGIFRVSRKKQVRQPERSLR